MPSSRNNVTCPRGKKNNESSKRFVRRFVRGHVRKLVLPLVLGGLVLLGEEALLENRRRFLRGAVVRSVLGLGLMP